MNTIERNRIIKALNEKRRIYLSEDEIKELGFVLVARRTKYPWGQLSKQVTLDFHYNEKMGGLVDVYGHGVDEKRTYLDTYCDELMECEKVGTYISFQVFDEAIYEKIFQLVRP